jgi:cytochrome c553
MSFGFGKVLALAAAALLAAACTTAMVSSKHEKKEASGPAIQLGQGHFSKDNKAFRYWDKEPAIPPVCSKCHAMDGLATFLKDGKNPASPHVKGYGFACTNCHVDAQTFALRDAPKVTFASGATVASRPRA